MDRPIIMEYGTGNDSKRIAELEQELQALREVARAYLDYPSGKNMEALMAALKRGGE